MAIEKCAITTIHDPLILDLIDFLEGFRGNTRQYVHEVLRAGGTFIIEKAHDSYRILKYTEVSEEANMEVAF